MRKKMYVAKYDAISVASSIIPILVIKETVDFVVLEDDIKGTSKLKKKTDDHCIFDFFIQAKEYLAKRVIDDIDYFYLMMQTGETEVERLKKMKHPCDTVEIGDLYQVIEDAHYTFRNISLCIKAGFMYDGASIPKAFWIPIGSPFHPRFMKPAAFHDNGYGKHDQPKDFYDDLFLHLLLEEGVDEFKAKEMYEAVHLCGQYYWDRKGTIDPSVNNGA